MMNLDETKKTYYAVAFLESENIRKKKDAYDPDRSVKLK